MQYNHIQPRSLALYQSPESVLQTGPRRALEFGNYAVAWYLRAVFWSFFFACVFVLVRMVFLFLRLALKGYWLFWQYCASPFWVAFALLWPASRAVAREVPNVPEGIETDGNAQPLASGDGDVGTAEFRSVPLTAHMCARPRRRAVWVRRLELILGPAAGPVGALVRGRWRPDLPSSMFSTGANLVLEYAKDGVKIRGGGSVLVRPRGDDEPSREAYLVIEFSDGSREVVFPRLVAKLAAYAFLRERNAVLVSALRTRALEWFKGFGVASDIAFVALPGCFRLAWEVSPSELRAREALSGGPSPTLWWTSA